MRRRWMVALGNNLGYITLGCVDRALHVDMTVKRTIPASKWKCKTLPKRLHGQSPMQYCCYDSAIVTTILSSATFACLVSRSFAHYSSRPNPIIPKHFAEPGSSLASIMNHASPFCLSPRAIQHIRRCLLSWCSCIFPPPLLQHMCATCPPHLRLQSVIKS
jgi:hypothetical protein